MHPRKEIAHQWHRNDDHMTVQALLCPCLSWLHPLPPRRAMCEHRIDDRQQLAHAGHQGHLLGLPHRTQALIETSNDGIEACGDDRCHIEGGTHLSPPTPDRAATAQRAAIPIERRDADERGNLFVRQRPQFREICQQRGRQDRADAGHTPQEFILLPPDRTLPERLGQVGVGLVQGPFQPDDVGPQLFANHHAGAGHAVLLRREHLDELATARDQGRQLLRLGSGQGSGRTTSAKWANTCASSASVFANRPVALAKSRICRGLTTTTGRPAAANAPVSGSSTPPVASTTIKVGGAAARWASNWVTPASVFGTVNRPAGRCATSNCAFDTSIPTKRRG
jgi:hypothetical protein